MLASVARAICDERIRPDDARVFCNQAEPALIEVTKAHKQEKSLLILSHSVRPPKHCKQIARLREGLNSAITRQRCDFTLILPWLSGSENASDDERLTGDALSSMLRSLKTLLARGDWDVASSDLTDGKEEF